MRIGPKWLFALAASAVLLLTLFSDPVPPASQSLAQAASSNSPTAVVCQVVEVQERTNGTTLTIIDADQGQAKAFMPRSLGAPPAVGQVVIVILAPSDRPSFFFVEDLSYP
ncbi:MAG: hypothetical protein LUQ16_03670 [Methanomassiliicoccales archaeon]|jgi:hypothetical protein|nr:hypothetical protein [Methanomassiliicoccales archaeon]MDD1756242.1 hypothetical protein [Methanomassiliicoccales archaeon]